MSLEAAKNTALEFSKLLASRDYSEAYALTSRSYKNNFNVADLQESFEDIIPNDWGTVDPVEISKSMTNWPDKKPSDIAWIYIVLGGDVYSEALILIITDENSTTKIRDVEFGRP